MAVIESIEEKGAALVKADIARLEVSPGLDPKRRSKFGQFMTPASVAVFVASMFDEFPEDIELLDAGAGMGALTAAFVREACSREKMPKSINVTLYEVDGTFSQRLAETLEACALECQAAEVIFSYKIISEDYILHASEPLFSQANFAQYDCAILNPPYAKINSSSKTRIALRGMGIETTNLYSAFVAVALDQLKDGGQLVAITPRSFCNGSYFEPFRRFVFKRSALQKIHVYESRKQAFKDDEVLQENIVYQLVKSASQPDFVTISSSPGSSTSQSTSRKVSYDEVVTPNDPHMFIRLAISEADGDLAHRVRTLTCSLRDLGLTVSTGRVVDFRAREYLRKEPEFGSVPLIYPCHFEGGIVKWPKSEVKKSNALMLSAETASLMVPKGTYVLTKRFSSKEEKRRVVAAIYSSELIKAEQVGFENHLNYFHLNGAGLPAGLAKGLALFLNSTAVDNYFRQFSGHTQVNATDLRNLHYPTIQQLEAAGRRLGNGLPTQESIDKIVEALL